MALDDVPADWGAHVGEELRKSFQRYMQNGFFSKFLSGAKVLDLGYKGYVEDATPIFPHAIGVDLDYPGYDGKRLPFPDQSQDAVFSSHTLEHVPDYRTTLADWFRVVRIGGFLVIAVPHQFLYERKSSPPSRWNADHKRFYTSASLLCDVEEALDPLEFRVRYLEENDTDFDYSIPPDRHAGGCYEIVLVIQKIQRSGYADKILHEQAPRMEPGVFRSQLQATADQVEPVIAIEGEQPGFHSIIALKLDHRGDFIMAKPALAELRRQFPDSRLTLACGPWNAQAARELELFDEIIEFEFFDEIGPNTKDSREKIAAAFADIVHGRIFDLAIDLRVDEDTRDLLSFVHAEHRAGFGRPERFPFLDIALPFINPTFSGRATRFLLKADQFVTRIGQHLGFWIVFNGRPEKRPPGELLVYGPYADLEAGRYEFEVSIEPLGRDFEISYDVCRNLGQDVLQVGTLTVAHGRKSRIVIDLPDFAKGLELRLFVAPHGRVRSFRFSGCVVSRTGVLLGPHQQEMQALLVYLVAMRARHPYKVRNIG